MEIEQELSNFQKIPAAKIMAAASVFGAPAVPPADSYKKDKITDVFRNILSNCYRWLDNLAGHQSHLILNSSNDFSATPAYEIFRLLEDRNLFIHNITASRYNDAPFFHRADLMPLYAENSTDGKIVKSAIGHGFGKDAEDVLSKAIGELLERYFLTLYHKKNFIRASIRDLKKKKIPVLDLNFLPTFSEEQKKRYSKRRFNEDSVFCWEKIKRLLTDETIYAPAQLAYWNYIAEETEPVLLEGNTNGAGGFFTKEKAILAGLYELIQRDSFFMYWLNSLTPKLIDPKSVPDENFQKLLEEAERYGFEVYCLNITADTAVPAFVVIVSDSSGQMPRFSLGGGCQSDPAKALHRALEEAWSVYYWMRKQPLFPALDENYVPFSMDIDQSKRLRLWANPEMEKHLNFFISGKKEKFSEINFDYPKNFASPAEELEFLAKRVENMGPGYEVYYYEARHPLLSELGYHSIQVIVPQIFPLYLHEPNAPLASTRLKEVPKKLGLAQSAKFNPLPHLFP